MRRAFALLQVVFTALLIAGAPLHAYAAKHVTPDAATAISEHAAPADLVKEASEPGLPQLDLALWPGQAFWLIISFLLIYLMMRYVALPKVEQTLDKREARITADIEQAKLLNEQAKQMSSDLDLRMIDARTRAADSVREVMHENAGKLAAAFAAQQKKLDESLKAAEADLNSQKQKAIAALDDEAAGMVEAILKRVTGSAPANDVLKSAWAKAKEG